MRMIWKGEYKMPQFTANDIKDIIALVGGLVLIGMIFYFMAKAQNKKIPCFLWKGEYKHGRIENN